MENLELAGRLEELADLLEIGGANPFRVRAYRNAVRTLKGMTGRVADMAARDEDLTDLPGIGTDISSHIHELLETGDLAILEEVTREVPRELAILTRLDGVGPKKVARLWKELGITRVDQLEAAVEDGRVERLSGFGKRSAEKILVSIGDFRKQQGRFLRHEAVQYLRPLLAHLDGLTGVQRLEVAGSYRRGKETVGDIDLLVAAGEDGPAVMKSFTEFEGVDRVEMSGSTRGSIVLRSGLPVDLRIVPEEVYGAALHYFTGSKEHNVQIRARARKRGLQVSEYGVFELPDEEDGGSTEGSDVPDADRRIAGRTEEEVFEAVGLAWMPPELRQGRGEIDAADEGTLPDLVDVDDIRGDLHMHTTWSDGKETIETMARACLERGYEYMAITDHSQAVTVANGLSPDRLREQAIEVEEARSRVDGIRILHGCEVDILKDGSLDLPDDVLEELDIVLVAVHSHFRLSREEQTARILRAVRHPLVDVLVHPTGRLLNRREPYEVELEPIFEAAVEHGVAVELNTNPRRLDLRDQHLRRAKELGALVSVGTDSHRLSELELMEAGLLQARRGWLESSDVLNARPLDDLLARLSGQV